jgi:tetratricopeptide (TPR) repeat protein
MQVRLIRMAALAVLASVAVAGCGKYSISNIRSLKAFQDANSLYRKADYEAAIVRYEDAVRFNPDLGFAYFFLGNSYDSLYKPARQGEPENDANLPKAVENYRLAIQKMADATDPKEQEIRKLAYEFLIAAYGIDKLNDFEEAEPVAREMIAMEPDNPANYQALAGLYENQGMYEEAEAEFTNAINLNPSDPFGYQMLAGYYNRQGEFEKTMEAFMARAEMEPNNPEAWHTMSSFYQEKVFRDKTLPRAKQIEYINLGLEADDKALALNPEYFEALTYKNILLRMKAGFETTAAGQQALIDEADALRDRAMELQAQQQLDASAAAAAGSGGGGGGQ